MARTLALLVRTKVMYTNEGSAHVQHLQDETVVAVQLGYTLVSFRLCADAGMYREDGPAHVQHLQGVTTAGRTARMLAALVLTRMKDQGAWGMVSDRCQQSWPVAFKLASCSVMH
jgi:hypothetical protein